MLFATLLLLETHICCAVFGGPHRAFTLTSLHLTSHCAPRFLF